MATLNGLRVITSPYLTEPGEPVEVRRPWRERLFTIPWRPLTATRTVVPQVPMRGGLIIGDTVVMHPAMLDTLSKDRLWN